MMETKASRARFGTFELDLRLTKLHAHGQATLLQEQVFRVLELLIEHDGDLATRRCTSAADCFDKFDGQGNVEFMDDSPSSAIEKQERAGLSPLLKLRGCCVMFSVRECTH